MPFDFAAEVWRLPAVKRVTQLGRSTIYLYVSQGRFPPPIRLGVRAVGWRAADVLRWIESRQVVGGENR